LCEYLSFGDRIEWKCSIRTCGKSLIPYAPETDGVATAHMEHNHKTGEIRGLTCDACNSVMGLAKEQKKRLLGILEYWEENGCERDGEEYRATKSRRLPGKRNPGTK
jgi:hypothetical protein